MTSFVAVSVLGVLFFSCLLDQGNTAVISIDFSSEWIKIALVKPGVPMEIVLNKESKRKTAAVVAFRNDERMFSDPALSTAVKYPKNAYQYLQFIAGLQYDNPLVQKYRDWFPYYDIRKDETRNTLVFQHSDDQSFTTEELIGMLLNNSRELAQDYAGVPIKNAIITVPPFYTQAQRKSILLSAQLVGLNVLQLITDNAAVALNYGVFRRNSFNTSATYMMFFDMGSTSTTASVVEYKKVQVKEGDTAHMEPQLTVKGVGFDRTLGGLEMDMRLRDHLAQLFTSKHKTKKPIYESPRAMAKLLKEAKRLKMILSANVDHRAQIEGVHEEIDFSAKVTRVEFEEMCADLFDRIAEPVKQALKISEITMSEIESVMLVGGATRVPKVQEKLLHAVKRSELGKQLNTDEAAALGAVYQAASHSKLFRVKKFIVKEFNSYPIQVSFDKPIVDSDGNATTRTITRTLFNVGNPYPQKKILSFNKYNGDFGFSVFYGKIDFLSEQQQSYIGPFNLSTIALKDVSKALEDNPEGAPGGIKAHFRMDENGLLTLESVQSHFEYEVKEEASTFSKITSAFTNLFGGSEEEGGEEGGAANGTGGEVKDNTTGTPQDSTPEQDDVAKPADNEGAEPETQEDTPTEEGEKEGEEKEEEESVKETETEEEDESDNEDEEESEDDIEDGEEEEEEGEETKELPDEESVKEDVDSTNEGDIPSDDATSTSESASSTESTGVPTETPPTETPPTAKESDNKPKKKKDGGVKTKTVKVNVTVDTQEMDWSNVTVEELEESIAKLSLLQLRDQEKRENELAKNNLESHIFEFTDFMYTDEAATYSSEEERETITENLRTTSEWLEEDGYDEETSVYKQKLKDLKRLSRPVVRRKQEASKRPELFQRLRNSINVSVEFLGRMKNISELEIFTDVEAKTLADASIAAQAWLLEAETKQNATKSYEDPVILCTEIEDQIRKLDREVYYLMNKVKNYKPKKPKTTPINATNVTNTTSGGESKTKKTHPIKEEKLKEEGKEETTKESPKEDQNEEKDQVKEEVSTDQQKEEEEEKVLALPPPPSSDDDTDTDDSTDTADDHSEL